MLALLNMHLAQIPAVLDSCKSTPDHTNLLTNYCYSRFFTKLTTKFTLYVLRGHFHKNLVYELMENYIVAF